MPAADIVLLSRFSLGTPRLTDGATRTRRARESKMHAYIGNHFGTTRYNGGCVRAGQWWQGEHRPLPSIPAGYEIIDVPTWGKHIRKKAA